MSEPSDAIIPTGIEGLDAILRGGLPRNRMVLIQGEAGTGKTTIALQFALAGAARGESTLYITLAETIDEISNIAESHGWSSDPLRIVHQTAAGAGEARAQTVLHPAEIELPATVDAILEQIESSKPERLVIDSLSELRILAREPRWFRRELMRLRARLDAVDCTTLLLDTEVISQEAESLLGSVIRLERITPNYGPDRRRVQVLKMRGHEFVTGYHDVRIRRGGVAVYPRLVAANHRATFAPETFSTGLEELDEMLGGGLDRGTAVLLLGPTGTGKSTLAVLCAAAAARRGERSLLYVFDERLQTVVQRAAGIGIDLGPDLDAGLITIRQVDPAELTPGEFSEEVRSHVQERGVRLVVIDSLNAYVYAMPNERLLNLHLHELLAYLSQQAVTSLLVGTQHGLLEGTTLGAGLDVSYLADTVLLHRLVQIAGRLKKVLAVYKRRAGAHDAAGRELRLAPGHVSIGEVMPLGLREFARGGAQDDGGDDSNTRT